jgi:transposase
MRTSSKPPQDWREARRIRALELKQQGWKQRDIAAAFGVTEGAVSQWLKRAAAGGVEALRRGDGRGAKPKLQSEQWKRLIECLEQGAKAFGFADEVWTQPRVAWLIEREFGVKYHPSHVGRLLKQLGWSRQQPLIRASQRDEAAISRWSSETWPQLEKKRVRRAGR